MRKLISIRLKVDTKLLFLGKYHGNELILTAN